MNYYIREMNLRDILREFPVILPILYLLTSCITFWGFTIKVIEKLKKMKKHDNIEIVNKEILDKLKVANILRYHIKQILEIIYEITSNFILNLY